MAFAVKDQPKIVEKGTCKVYGRFGHEESSCYEVIGTHLDGLPVVEEEDSGVAEITEEAEARLRAGGEKPQQLYRRVSRIIFLRAQRFWASLVQQAQPHEATHTPNMVLEDDFGPNEDIAEIDQHQGVEEIGESIDGIGSVEGQAQHPLLQTGEHEERGSPSCDPATCEVRGSPVAQQQETGPGNRGLTAAQNRDQPTVGRISHVHVNVTPSPSIHNFDFE
ncbi:hypothetical protein Cgig2_007926 [Carnegiea gigantea]|uniref:Uncharacterized protein n=1 Tax=Carnegiea gigantea TaxID=171969 RepID=A0A9Q1KEY6_9CARY|nr:hypothetical protein Cgig2_007926 [Carnegiea gigantea]